jgi:hypothetical protein
MPKLLTGGAKGGQSSVISKQSSIASEERTAKEEMREMLATVRPVALRERLLKVWAKW